MLDPEGHKKKTAQNRMFSAEYLHAMGISFVSKNGGAHLIVSHSGITVDFWPGTGLFIGRGLRGRGVRNLVRIIKGSKQWKVYSD
jgi:hypothetical protein